MWQLHCQTLGISEWHGSSEMTIKNGYPVSQWVWHAKDNHCSMAKSAKQRPKCVALHRLRLRLHMSDKFSSWTNNPNKQTLLDDWSNTFLWLLFFSEIYNTHINIKNVICISELLLLDYYIRVCECCNGARFWSPGIRRLRDSWCFLRHGDHTDCMLKWCSHGWLRIGSDSL